MKTELKINGTEILINNLNNELIGNQINSIKNENEDMENSQFDKKYPN